MGQSVCVCGGGHECGTESISFTRQLNQLLYHEEDLHCSQQDPKI